jgi:sterol desaturase/sphingolipid hydroxylase (fatty acid hydroxylase superfamily)
VPTGSLKGTLGDLTGGGPLFTDEQPLAFEQGWLDLAAPSPRMARGHDEDELIEEPGRDALFAEPERVSSDHPKIQRVSTDLLFDEGGVRNAQAQGHPGICLLECRDDAREHIDPRRGTGPEDERAALEPAEVGHGFSGACQGREEPVRMVLEDAAGFGEGHLPSQAVEETGAQLALHLRHVLGEGGLAQVHGLSGGTETPGFRHGQEDFELPKGRLLHKPHLIRVITTSDWSLCKAGPTLGPVNALGYEPAIRLGVFVVVFVVLAAGEALIPRRNRAVTRRWRWPTNITLVVLNTVLVRTALPVTAVGMAVIAEERGWGLLNAIGPLPTFLAVGVAVVLLDLAIYLQHVLFHAVPVLWRLHRMHHADIDVDVTTGSRFHPGEILLSMLLKFASISALGASPLAVLSFEVLLNTGSMLDHANLRLPLVVDRVLRLLVVTPDMHRVHHSAVSVETDTNFGFTFPWWDYLCGTYRAQPAAGHEAMTVGLTCFRDRKYLRLDKTLLQPLFDGHGPYAARDRHAA